MPSVTPIALVAKFYENFVHAAEKVFGRHNVTKKFIHSDCPFKDGALVINLKSEESGKAELLCNNLFIHIMPWVNGEIRATFNECVIFDKNMFERMTVAAQSGQDIFGLNIHPNMQPESKIHTLYIDGFDGDEPGTALLQTEHLARALKTASDHTSRAAQ